MELKESQEQVSKNDFESTVNIVGSGIKYFLYGVIFLTIASLMWGVFGKIPIKSNGFGIITTENSNRFIQTNYSGIVDSIYKKIGDTVYKGDKLTKLIHFDISQRNDEKILELNQEILENSTKLTLMIKEEKMKLNYFDKKISDINNRILIIKEEISYMEESYSKKEILYDKGIISKVNLNDLKFQLQNKRNSLSETESEKYARIFEKDTYINNNMIEKERFQDNLLLIKEQLKNLEISDERSTYIISHSNGIIQEILVKENENISAKQNIVVIEGVEDSDNPNLFLNVFLPFSEESNTDVGMNVIAAPSNVDKNRYGQILCEIIQVSNMSATEEFIESLVVDPEIVKYFTSKGPVYFSKAKVKTDKNTISGLKWTSKEGAPYKIHSGVICEAEIIVEYVSPISFVIPFLKKELADNEN